MTYSTLVASSEKAGIKIDDFFSGCGVSVRDICKWKEDDVVPSIIGPMFMSYAKRSLLTRKSDLAEMSLSGALTSGLAISSGKVNISLLDAPDINLLTIDPSMVRFVLYSPQK